MSRPPEVAAAAATVTVAAASPAARAAADAAAVAGVVSASAAATLCLYLRETAAVEGPQIIVLKEKGKRSLTRAVAQIQIAA